MQHMPKEIWNKNILRQHLRYVHGEIKHRCNICDKEVRTCELNTHIAINHAIAENYTCDICERTFSRKDGLKIHFQRHHSKKQNQIHNHNIDTLYFYSMPQSLYLLPIKCSWDYELSSSLLILYWNVSVSDNGSIFNHLYSLLPLPYWDHKHSP